MKIFFSVLLFLPLAGFAQKEPLIANGSGTGIYLTHAAGPKENFYSIGRLYNISPKEIAPFNNLNLENGLSIGQQIKIPLTAGNFSKSMNAAADEASIPVHQTVSGKRQVIGYLHVKKELSALARNAGVPTMVVPPSRPVIADETVVATPPPAKMPAPVKQPPVVSEAERTQPAKTEPVAERTNRKMNGGAFKASYRAGSNDETGRAGTFKSTSGWEDGKYYCLHNSAPQNSIIKITNTVNNKTVYARVLDVIPDLKQNKGLTLQLSAAGADELGVAGEFVAAISY